MQYQEQQVEPSWSYYMRRISSSSSNSTSSARMMEEEQMERVVRLLASQSAVVMFSISSCCMCHAMKRLFCGMGVNPIVHELDHDPNGREMERALLRLLLGGRTPHHSSTTTSSVVPVVFIGGKLVGSMDRVLAFHINGSLVPLLKDAGALWL